MDSDDEDETTNENNDKDDDDNEGSDNNEDNDASKMRCGAKALANAFLGTYNDDNSSSGDGSSLEGNKNSSNNKPM